MFGVPIGTNALAHAFFPEPREKDDGDDSPRDLRLLLCEEDALRLGNTVFLVAGATPLKNAYQRHDLEFEYERHRNRNSVERIFPK